MFTPVMACCIVGYEHAGIVQEHQHHSTTRSLEQLPWSGPLLVGNASMAMSCKALNDLGCFAATHAQHDALYMCNSIEHHVSEPVSPIHAMSNLQQAPVAKPHAMPKHHTENRPCKER